MDRTLKKGGRAAELAYMLPAFVFVLSIVLMRLKLRSMPMSDVYWSDASDSMVLADTFTYYKSLAVMLSAALALLFAAAARFKGGVKFKRSFLYVPVLVYAVFSIISYAFSDYRYFALRGLSDHSEGLTVLLCYMVMLLFLYNFAGSESKVKAVVLCALLAAGLLGLLGLTQAAGRDFLATAAGQKLVTPNYVLDTGMTSWDMIDALASKGETVYNFLFKEGQVYQTVYNPNYVPMYLSLLIPVSAALFLHASCAEGRAAKLLSVLHLALFALLLYNFFAANSASGYLGLVAILIAFLFAFGKYARKFALRFLCLALAAGIVMSMLSDRWVPEVRNMLGTAAGMAAESVYADGAPAEVPEYENAPGSVLATVDYIESCGNHMDFSLNGNVLRITRDEANAAYGIADESGQSLYIREIEGEEGRFEVLDERFHDYVKLGLGSEDGTTYIYLNTAGYDWPFRHNGEDFVYRNVAGKETVMRRVPHAAFIKDDGFASGRGLIWNTALPMLKDCILKGEGPDCFVFAYPQNDYAARYNIDGTYRLHLVTDKAHNLYLQIWVNTGLVSLIAWLAIVGFYLQGAVRSFKRRGFSSFSDYANAGIFAGILGFAATALFNDGSLSTMPMFYAMLGTGLAINAMEPSEGNGAAKAGPSA